MIGEKQKKVFKKYKIEKEESRVTDTKCMKGGHQSRRDYNGKNG